MRPLINGIRRLVKKLCRDNLLNGDEEEVVEVEEVEDKIVYPLPGDLEIFEALTAREAKAVEIDTSNLKIGDIEDFQPEVIDELTLAIENEDIDNICKLLPMINDINLKNSDGETVYEVALSKMNVEILNLLEDFGVVKSQIMKRLEEAASESE